MSEPDDPAPRYPRNKDELLRDFTVAARLHEIRDSVNLRQHLAPKWWEAGIVLLQFAAALGLLASILQWPPLRHDALGRLVVFWLALMILSLVLGFEILLFRLHHLRRANQITLKRIEELEQRLEAMENDARSGVGNGAPADNPHPAGAGAGLKQAPYADH